MSAKAVGWALEQKLGAAQKVTLIVLADCMNTETGKCCPGQAFIAERVGCSDRTIRVYLGQLEGAGLIRRIKRNHPVDGHRLSDGYVLAVGGALPAESSGRSAIPTGSGTTSQPEAQASGEPEGEPEVSLFAGARATDAGPKKKPITYRGRKVPKDQARLAETLLAHFASETKRSLPSYTGQGDPTPEIKQVVGAIMLHPDVGEPTWKRAISNTVQNPPSWVDGTIKLGHVFGGRAVAWALDNAGANGNGKGDHGTTGEVHPHAQRLVEEGVITAEQAVGMDGYEARRIRRKQEGW